MTGALNHANLSSTLPAQITADDDCVWKVSSSQVKSSQDKTSMITVGKKDVRSYVWYAMLQGRRVVNVNLREEKK